MKASMTNVLTATIAMFAAASSALAVGVVYDGSGNPLTVLTESISVNSSKYTFDTIFGLSGSDPGFLTATGNGGGLLLRDWDLDNDGVAENGTPVLLKAAGWSIIWRSRAISATHPGSLTEMVGGGDDTNNFSIRFNTDGTLGGGSVQLFSNGTVPNPASSDTYTGIDLTQFHTFALIRAPGGEHVEFSIDGLKVLELVPRPLGLPGSDFGNINSFHIAPSQVEWAYDFIHINIPEPAGLALLGMGGAAAISRRRRR